MDLLIGTASILDEEIDTKNLALVVVDEKTELASSDFDKLLKLESSNLDIMFLSSRPLPESLAHILYPCSRIDYLGYKQGYKCNVSSIKCTLFHLINQK